MAKYNIISDIIVEDTNRNELMSLMSSFMSIPNISFGVHKRVVAEVELKDPNRVDYTNLLEKLKEDYGKEFKVHFIYLIAIINKEKEVSYAINKYYLNPDFKYLSNGTRYLPLSEVLTQLHYKFKDNNDIITDIEHDFTYNK